MRTWKKERLVQLAGVLLSVLALVGICLLLVELDGRALAEDTSAATGSGSGIDLTQICVAVITLVFGLITGKLWPWIQARTTAAQREGLTSLAKTLVFAAEQLKKTGVIQDKLQYVQNGLAAAGYTIDRNAIEAAVTQLRNETGASMVDSVTASGGVVMDGVELQSATVDGDALSAAIADGIKKGMSGGGTDEQADGLDAAEAEDSEAVPADDAAAGTGGGTLAADAQAGSDTAGASTD